MTTPRIVTRAEWKARPRRGTAATVNIGARTATCTHHDGANIITVRSFAEACARVRADQNYHMNSNGWDDIGYNFLVISAPGVAGVDGLIFEGRGRDVVGAHCLNWNTPWIGIQVAIGGAQKPSPASLSSVRWLHDTFTAAAKHALAKKVHSDGFPTACPADPLRNWVHAGMPVALPARVVAAVILAVTVSRNTVRAAIAPTRNIPMTVAIQRACHVLPDGKWGDGTSAAATAVIRRNLANVRALQGWVGTRVDGAWGPLSEAARIATIKRIQSAIGVIPDGAWGPLSQAAWNRAYAANFHRY